MTVLPGSLDYLYYNGILDHIPYEAYGAAGGNLSYNSQNVQNQYNSYSQNSQLQNTQLQNTNIKNSHVQNSHMQNTYTQNATTYLNSAQSGHMYNTYSAPDSFIKSSGTNSTLGSDYSASKTAFGYNNGVGANYDFEKTAFGQEGLSFRESIVSGAKNTTATVSTAPTFVKGLLASGILIGTLVCLLKGGKAKVPPEKAAAAKKSFTYYLNPKNWFKKKS